MIEVSGAFKETFPRAAMGILIMRNAHSPGADDDLAQRRDELERRLRERYAGATRADLLALQPLDAYAAYYRRFGKTYHVLLQLESVALKGKPIPHAAGAVGAMFLAELDNLLLTAGHDLAAVRPPIRIEVSRGDEQYIKMNGQVQVLTPGDMIMRDAEGVMSCVLHGPDRRTRIVPETKDLLFVVYAPEGVSADLVRLHLEEIGDSVRMLAPQAVVDLLEVY